jgi:hypothetical protein
VGELCVPGTEREESGKPESSVDIHEERLAELKRAR